MSRDVRINPHLKCTISDLFSFIVVERYYNSPVALVVHCKCSFAVDSTRSPKPHHCYFFRNFSLNA